MKCNKGKDYLFLLERGPSKSVAQEKRERRESTFVYSEKALTMCVAFETKKEKRNTFYSLSAKVI